MPPGLLIDATDLDSWASRLDAKVILPQLVRRLVLASANDATRVSFRAGEGVQLPGWDGIIVAEQGNAFVPHGVSCWELGTSADIKGKADDDYEKRTHDPDAADLSQSAFIFVTPRRWSRKEEWAQNRRAEGHWRDVRALDADDLEGWLETAPATHTWISILLGKHPTDAEDLETSWDDWSTATRPVMQRSLVLSGRGETTIAIHRWLSDLQAPLALQAESREEALAVFAAALHELPEDDRLAYLARTLVVRTIAAWDRLSASGQRLILVPVFEDRSVIVRAARRGHGVVLPLGLSDTAGRDAIRIPRLSVDAATKGFEAQGMPPDKARDLAAHARRGLMSLRRRLAVNPEVQQPAWADAAHARDLLPAMLTGAWSERDDREDRQCIASLARKPYEDFCAQLVRWANTSDPPARLSGNEWYLVSREDAWTLLARFLTRADLDLFEKVSLDVLGTPDPSFDLPEEDQWKARLIGASPRHTGLLRDSVADTLAIMGAHGDVSLPGVRARDYAGFLVRRVFECANSDWRIWASLSSELRLLGEASPDEFLSAVEGSLQGASPIATRLFTDGRVDNSFSSSPHTGLLWALETLSWSGDLLGRSAVVLAKLARVDPGGRLANRPLKSLRQIFLPWFPQTAATVDQRLAALDAVRATEPVVGWKLLCELVPTHHGTALHGPKPRRRDWAPDAEITVTTHEYASMVDAVVTRMLADVGQNTSFWPDLIQAIPTIPPERFDSIVTSLEALSPDALAPPNRCVIWNALRELIADHRSFGDASWALPSERVDRLAVIHARFEPEDLLVRYGWLFDAHPKLPIDRGEPWDAREQELAQRRLDAVTAIYASSGVEALLQLADRVEHPEQVGWHLGRSELCEEQENALLQAHLGSAAKGRMLFARGVAAGRIETRGRAWAETKLTTGAVEWTPEQRAELLIRLPDDSNAWDLAERFGAEAESAFWRIKRWHRIINPDLDLERALRKLLEHGCPWAAVDLAAQYQGGEHGAAATLVAEVLNRALETCATDDRPDQSSPDHISELLDVLERSGVIDDDRMARLEWGFIPLLGERERPPKALLREIVQNAAFFAQLVAVVFRSENENESREVSEEEAARARCGSELLNRCRTVPGTMEGGDVDSSALLAWVDQAREALARSSHLRIGDQTLGQMLSGAFEGSDDSWPHPAVCDVVERCASVALESGVEVGVRNSRGVYSKSPTEGGDQERRIAARYAAQAATRAARWPRTAAVLRRIAESYMRAADREDSRAALRTDLDR